MNAQHKIEASLKLLSQISIRREDQDHFELLTQLLHEAKANIQRPVMYATMYESTGEIELSAYPINSDEWENNHITVLETRGNGIITKHHSVLNILTNVLYQAGVRLVIE